MLIFILAESSLETIPPELRQYKAIRLQAMKRRKKTKELLLDSSRHHYYMRNLKDAEKRGRPDIVHITLLNVLGTPLNKEGLLQTYVHTINDKVLYINPETRLPKNYNRFVGLMEQLFVKRKVPPKGKTLIKLRPKTLKGLLEEIKPTMTVIFTGEGEPVELLQLMKELSKHEKLAVIVGGFPHGTFKKEHLQLADLKVSIDPEPLEAWTVASRIIYAYETAINLPETRINKVKQR
nr:16S rRNA methyltransferase [Candidatus Baldrarchaeota archaeon]